MSEPISRRQATGILGGAATSLLVGEARAEHANVAERVTKLIVEHMDVDRGKVKPETTFTALGADSLDCVELTMAAEEEFNIVVDDKVAVTIKTVGEMIRHIEASPKAPPPRNEPKKK
jgi:acyl carrier protein